MNPTGPKTEPPRDLPTPTPSAADLRCPIGFAELPESQADRPAGVSRISHASAFIAVSHPPQEFRGYFSTHLLSPVAGPNKSPREQSDFKFFTLNFTLSREFHPFENRAFLERSRAGPHRISITRREEPLK